MSEETATLRIIAHSAGHATGPPSAPRDSVAVVTGYLRYPHLHGDLLTLVAEDDVWLAPVDGGRAWRRTADRAPAADPRFSPDGSWLAWASGRDGAPEVHVAPVDGGQATRLTYWGDYRTAVRGWIDDDVLAVTAAGRFMVDRTRAHAVPVDGGQPRPLPYGPVRSVAFGPSGAVLLGTALARGYSQWKRYRGGTIGRVWLDADGSGDFIRILCTIDGNIVDPVFVAGRIAFLSDHEGIGNVYSVLPDGSDLRRHTDHGEFYARQLSTDGARLVYQCAGALWLVEDLDADAQPRRLDIRLCGPDTGRAPRIYRGTEHLGEFSPDHTGRGSAVELLGTVHWLTHRDGPVRILTAEPGARARLPVVLGESGDAAWVTDAYGDDALQVAPVDGSGTAQMLAAGELGRVLELVAAPDGRSVAAASHDGRVLLVEVSSGQVREVARGEHGDASGLAFSPDSAWLAWSHAGPAYLRQIRLADVADLNAVDVTELRFVDTDPVFTVDGKHLAFLSVRSFDPVYDAHSFALSFPTGCRPYLVPLAATSPAPFYPEPDGRPTGEPDSKDDDVGSGGDDNRDSSGSGDGDGEDGATKDGSGSDGNKDAPATVRVDLDGLSDRLVGLPVPEANYSTLRAAKDGLLWLRWPVSGALGDGREGASGRAPRPVLERYDLRKRRLEVLADGLDSFEVSGNGRRLVVRDNDQLRVQPADSRGSDGDHGDDRDDEFGVDLRRLRVQIDPPAQWRQMFDEAARLMRDHFWAPDMADVDWDGVQAQYRPLLDRITSVDELVDVLWEVAGELGTSHAVVWPSGHHRLPSWTSAGRQGHLGADLERDADGVWRVRRVLPGESSDPQARSPLRAPGVAVRAGDALLAVNGVPVDPVRGPSVLLAGTADQPVELTVQSPDDSAQRRVAVVPLASEDRLRYQDWVLGRREHVRRRTDGRVGYLHLPDMMGFGWAQLHRDLRVEVTRSALIVDVRGNRGGHVSQLVVEKLARRVLGWDLGRHTGPTTYPLDAPRGPIVAVSDEFAGSDGDIVTAAIKALGIGPVVGTRTWGGVIGIDLRYTLVDGTLVTQPRYATWFDGHGWDIENYGVNPDIEVVARPQDWAIDRDPQLDTAIDLAVRALQERPAAQPPDVSTRPSRRRPVLPPRRRVRTSVHMS
jgi:tricorn protease